MADIGLTWVRIGEFAWSKIEPTPDSLAWGWLDEAIETLGNAGLKVVLGTPTATPPRWMIDKHPDMVLVDAEGRPRKHGGRRHYCFSHIGYRAECERIVRLLASRYGRNPHIHAWQTDNEYGCHDTTLSYSSATHKGFQTWLRRRYQTPDVLNRAWGNAFWSMEYNEFEQIDLPNLTVAAAGPAHIVDFRRFSSDAVAEYNQLQVHIIRQHSDAPIFHNFMGAFTDFDAFRVGQDLDGASWDVYPLGSLDVGNFGDEAHKQRYRCQGDPDFQAFNHDVYRSVGAGRWWIMEQQPGPVNWAANNAAPLKGVVRLWTWEAFAHGAEAVCYFRWRQAPFAQEQMHAGLQHPDRGAAPATEAARTVAAELADLPEAEAARAPVAILYDYPSAWAWETLPHASTFSYVELVLSYYRSLRKLGLSIDIVSQENLGLNSYRLVIIPGLLTMTAGIVDALRKFDGWVVAGPRTGSKTPDTQIPVDLPPCLPGMNVKVTHVDTIRPGVRIPLAKGGAAVTWREQLETGEEVIENTEKGNAVAVQREKTVYIGAWLDAQALWVAC